MNELYQLGLGGAVAILILDRVFGFVSKFTSGNKGDRTDNLTTVINNNTMVMTLIQERLRHHEENATKRHEDMVSKHKELVDVIVDHTKDCRSQAEKLREVISR